MTGDEFDQDLYRILVLDSKAFADRLVEHGFKKPIMPNTFAYDPVAEEYVWSNDMLREVWHGIPLDRLEGVKVQKLLAELGMRRGPRKGAKDTNVISKEDAEKMIAEMRLKRLRELEDWE